MPLVSGVIQVNSQEEIPDECSYCYPMAKGVLAGGCVVLWGSAVCFGGLFFVGFAVAGFRCLF